MAQNVKVADLKVGDFVLDGIVSRVEVYLDYGDEVYMHLMDGNGFVSPVRLRPDALVLQFEDWTEDDWAAFLSSGGMS